MFVRGSTREVQAAALAVRAATGALRKDMHKNVRAELGQLWRSEMQSRASSRQDEQVIVRGGRVQSRADGFVLRAGTSRRPLSGGLYPDLDWHAVEFGARNRQGEVTRHTKRGKTTYRAMLNRGLPGRVNSHQGGRVAFDAASAVITRAVGIWVRTIVDTYREAAGNG